MNDLVIYAICILSRKKTKGKEEKACDLQCKEVLQVDQVNWNERIESIEETYIVLKLANTIMGLFSLMQS